MMCGTAPSGAGRMKRTTRPTTIPPAATSGTNVQAPSGATASPTPSNTTRWTRSNAWLKSHTPTAVNAPRTAAAIPRPMYAAPDGRTPLPSLTLPGSGYPVMCRPYPVPHQLEVGVGAIEYLADLCELRDAADI